jgi:hypothetical protein
MISQAENSGILAHLPEVKIAWVEPWPCDAEMQLSYSPFTNKQVNHAGKFLIGKIGKNRRITDSRGVLPALARVDTWRRTHAYPLRVVSSFVRHHAKAFDPDATISSRMKRMESMISKLERNPDMKITTMQDIGGCRAIVKSIADVRALKEYFSTQIEPHLAAPRKYDYVSEPKPDGYRSVHFVVKYQPRRIPSHLKDIDSAKQSKRIEIQVRSRLQHQWATAVETVDLFTGQTLKIGGGNAQWKRFFALTSSLFALKENSPLVPGTPMDRRELIEELRSLWKGLYVPGLLLGWSDAMHSTEAQYSGGPFDIYLVSINTEQMVTGITAFKLGEIKVAQQMYAQAEQNPNINAVLVSVSDISELRNAFPNYYGDTSEFIDEVNNTIIAAS